MKIAGIVLKVVAALAAVAGAVYVVATYGDKIVAWAKKLLGGQRCECDDCECNDDGECTCDCECGECDCGECEVAPAEEAAEEPAEETAEEAVEAAEADFEG